MRILELVVKSWPHNTEVGGGPQGVIRQYDNLLTAERQNSERKDIENQRLRMEIDDLRRQLDDAHARLEEVGYRRAVARKRRGLAERVASSDGTGEAEGDRAS